MAVSTYDYVIVGGGTAGCIIGARLAEQDATVCIIEGGPVLDTDPLVLDSSTEGVVIGNPDYDYDYTILKQEHANSGIHISRGRMLGGCSSTNSMISVRPANSELNAWAAAGCTGWDAASLAGAFERAKRRVGNRPAPVESPFAMAVHEAALALGLADLDPHQTGFGEVDASGRLYWNEQAGTRMSSAVAYLYPMAELPANLTLMAETRVERIRLDDRHRAVGVVTVRGEIRASREIIVCAGAIDSPTLLMRSGIGDPDALGAVGIETSVSLPGVGKNLQDHVETPVVWRLLRDPEPGELLGESALFRCGPSRSTGYEMFAHVIAAPFYEAQTMPDAPGMDSTGYLGCVVPNAAQPWSRGEIRLDPADPYGRPIIDARFLSDPDGHDVAALVRGVEFARQLAARPELRDWIEEEVTPGPAVRTPEELAEHFKCATAVVQHASGTCRMGAARDSMAVVDPHLRVRGVGGLRIADASVIPQLVSVNPCLTVMAIGERAIELILAESSSNL